MLIVPYTYNAEVILNQKRKKEVVALKDNVYYDIPVFEDMDYLKKNLVFELKFKHLTIPYYKIEGNILSPLWNSYYFISKHVTSELDYLKNSNLSHLSNINNLSSPMYQHFFNISDFSRVNKTDYIPLNLETMNKISTSETKFYNQFFNNTEDIYTEGEVKQKFSTNQEIIKKDILNYFRHSKTIQNNIFIKTDDIPVYCLDLKKKKITIVSKMILERDDNFIKDNVFYFQLNHKKQMINFLKQLNLEQSFSDMKDFDCDIVCGIDYVSDIYQKTIIQQVESIMDKIIDKKYFWNYSQNMILHIYEWKNIKDITENMILQEKMDTYFSYFNILSKLMDLIEEHNKPLIWQQKNDLFNKLKQYSLLSLNFYGDNKLLTKDTVFQM